MSDRTPNRKAKGLLVKGIEQSREPEAFEPLAADEFPHRRSIPDIDRRSLLKFMGGTMALAGLSSGCRFLPQQKIVPFVNAPEGVTPGVDRHFATAGERGGYGIGLLARSTEGRPVKLEGNPLHPSSLGSIDSMSLAEVAVLYDPDRLSTPAKLGSPSGWPEFFREARAALERAPAALLTPNVGSPSMAGVIRGFLAAHPGARWFQYEPVNRDSAREGAVMALGQPAEAVYHFEKADVVLSLDSDCLMTGPGHVRYQRDFSSRRQVDDDGREMSRVYAIEAVPTTLGATADHRFRAKPSEVLAAARAVAGAIGVAGAGGAAPGSVGEKAVQAIAKDLRAHAGRCLVVAGEHQSPAVHALAHAMNAALGNFGATVTYHQPVLAEWKNNVQEAKDLVSAIKQGQVGALFIVGGNPIYDMPSDLEFAETLKAVPLTAHLTLHDNETAHACVWELPMSHMLEAWGDVRGHDGTPAIVQPLIQPLYDSRSGLEFIDALAGRAREGREIVESQWRMPEKQWREALATGVLGAASAPVASSVVSNVASAMAERASGGMEVVVLPDPTVYDGRYGNCGWLQELPKPLTNLTWDNAVQMSPATAKKLGVNLPKRIAGVVPYYGNADLVTVKVNGREVTGPAYIHMGMADDTVAVHMGYGRKRGGQIGSVADGGPWPNSIIHGGFDAMPLITSGAPTIATGAEVTKAGGEYKLANAQYHNLLDVTEVDSDRDIIREVTLAEFKADHDALHHPTDGSHHPKFDGPTNLYKQEPSFYDEETNYQWAMTIDLNLCTGCGACVTACQAENNIPTVGKHEVLRGREMHWIRVDRYYQAKDAGWDENDPKISIQPLTCMQCEKAPCEPVCPVAATVHSHEGLNQMVYNRCVGTRYCSNNCPYKVRRFNFLHYTSKPEQVPVLKLLQNPDVTVRGRGVMEKCTYCVHRINHARIDAKKAKREIEDGEVVTACQQACPSRAIVFGDMRREGNAVAKSRKSHRNYKLLEALNTVPRTTYLGKVRNTNQELEA
jgi:Fe-S-cluster-containing dehydrogenase component